MTVVGADPGELRAAANQFTQAADRLQGSLKSLNSFVSNAGSWRGPDAERFRSEWSRQSVFSLNAAVGALQTAAEVLRRNADEQDDASRADGGSGRGPGAANGADQGKSSLKGNSIGSAPPADTNAMWKKLKDVEHTENSSGYRVQKVVDDKGTARYIVYIGGTDASDGQTILSNGPAAKGSLDEKQFAAIKKYIDPPDAEVMLVGFSQGGMDAQNIAHSKELNVKQVVTFGSPSRSDLDVPAVHLRSHTDPVPNSTTGATVLAAGVGALTGGLPGAIRGASIGANAYTDSAFMGGHNNEYFVADSKVDGLDFIKHHNEGYHNVSKEYDSAVQNGTHGNKFANADNFKGTVTDEVDVDVNGNLTR